MMRAPPDHKHKASETLARPRRSNGVALPASPHRPGGHAGFALGPDFGRSLARRESLHDAEALARGRTKDFEGGVPLAPAIREVRHGPASLGSRLPPKCTGGLSGLQRKLSIGSSSDPLEHEADRVAEIVMNGGGGADLTGIPVSVQGRSSGEPLREAEAPASVHRALGASGRPLDLAVRRDMESRFGRDFSQVRIHQGGEAEHSANEIGARAYTVGSDIVFGAGQFAPERSDGRRLLAHELAHVAQQAGGSVREADVVRRDLAVPPTVAAPGPVVLTADQIRAAIQLNSVYFTDPAEIAIIRDVLGVSEVPSVIDADLVNAIARYQANFALPIDGKLESDTSAVLEREITAESNYLNEAPAGTPMRRVARRLHLRSMTSRRTGSATHQGFVGPDGNPEGAVTARTGDSEAGSTNAISLEYTGENADSVNWLQFINMEMSARVPGVAAPVFNTGVVGTTGGNVTWSDAVTTNWFVDAVPGAASPLYDVSGFLNTRAAARRIAMFDQPGGPSGLPVAQSFALAGRPAAGATVVTMRMGFDSYAIRANQARYHVSWTATTTYDIPAASSSGIVYAQGPSGTVAGLAAVHRTALLADYPGNPIT